MCTRRVQKTWWFRHNSQNDKKRERWCSAAYMAKFRHRSPKNGVTWCLKLHFLKRTLKHGKKRLVSEHHRRPPKTTQNHQVLNGAFPRPNGCNCCIIYTTFYQRPEAIGYFDIDGRHASGVIGQYKFAKGHRRGIEKKVTWETITNNSLTIIYTIL